MKRTRFSAAAYVLSMILPFLTVFSMSSPAYAVCSNNEDGNPGQAGEIEYFTATNELMYCDDTNWILMTEPCGGSQIACGGNPDERVVFLTSTSSAKDERAGGLFGMDTTCTKLAYDAGLSGVFFAWAADTVSSNAPASRFEQPTVPYNMVNGTKIADDWSDLVDCTGSCLDDNIDRTEDNTLINSGVTSVVTNVNSDGTIFGTAANDSCDGWTAITGSPHRGRSQDTGSTWTANGKSGVCVNASRHYCFEQQGNDKVGLLHHTSLSSSPETDSIREITSWNNYAYIVSAGDNSVSSIDISDPVSSMSVADTYQDATNMGTIRGIDTDGNYIYIASTGTDTLLIVDISDPTNMVAPTGGNSGILTDGNDLDGAYGVAVQGDYAYVVGIGTNMNQLTVVDISDKASPSIAGTSGTITGSTKVDVDGNYAYVVSEGSNTITVVDVSTPSSPSISGSLTDNTNLDSPLFVKAQGNYAYVTASNSDSFTVVDVSTPSTPVIANSGSAVVTHGFYLDQVSGIVVDGDFAYVTKTASEKNGVTIIDISDPLNPFITAAIRHSNSYSQGTLSLTKSGKYLVAASATTDNLLSYEIVSNYTIGDTCSTAGEYYYDYTENKMVWCNGTNLVPMNYSGGGTAGCTSPTANEGAMDYDSTGTVFRFCDGNGWIDIGK